MRAPHGQEALTDTLSSPTTLEDLQPDVLYHILLFLTQQDVAHVKMCSSRLQQNILRACQHWAPKVESWLAADPSSVGLLQQLRGAGARQLQPPLAVGQQPFPAADLGVSCLDPKTNSSSSASRVDIVQQKQQAAVLLEDGGDAGEGCIPAGRGSADDQAAVDSSCALLARLPSPACQRLDWRQVWSCLERAQEGPWKLDTRRLKPWAFPHGVLLTFELLLQQPAPPAEPGAREQQSAGWRDCVTVLSFTLDGKAVDLTVDASGRVTSPQKDWSQGCIKLQAGQPKLLALEISYLLPVASWFLHPCTLAAPKPLDITSHTSLASSSSSSAGSLSSSLASSSTGHDLSWDCYSIATSSSSGGGGGCSLAHSAALCSAVSSPLTLSQSSLRDSSSGAASAAASIGRPRLCLDLSHGLGSYVSDPRFLDEATRTQKPRGLDRLEVAERVCWRPNKVQSWLGRLLPGIRAHSSSGSSSSSAGSHSSSGGVAATASSGSAGGSCVVGSPGGSGSKHPCMKPSFAVTASKVAVWQVPEDPEFRFMKGFEFWAVQHKAEQLLEHYGILTPWRGRVSVA